MTVFNSQPLTDGYLSRLLASIKWLELVYLSDLYDGRADAFCVRRISALWAEHDRLAATGCQRPQETR